MLLAVNGCLEFKKKKTKILMGQLKGTKLGLLLRVFINKKDWITKRHLALHPSMSLLNSINLHNSINWFLNQLDLSNVFLHGDLKEEVFNEQPPRFHDPNMPNHVHKLRKSLYELKQAQGHGLIHYFNSQVSWVQSIFFKCLSVCSSSSCSGHYVGICK